MKRTLVRLVLVLAVQSSPLAAQQFVFSIPSGWTDLSPGAPPANFQGVPQPILDDVRSNKYVATAFDFRDEDGFYENFSAVRTPEKIVLSNSLSDVRSEFETAYKKRLGDAVRILEADFVTIQGVRAFRIVLDYDHPNVAMRQVQYVMPGGDAAYAIVTYSAARQNFDRYRPVFEEAAQKTQGLREPTRSGVAEAVENLSTRVGSIFFVVLIVALVLAKALKKSPPKSMPPRRGGPPRPMAGRRPMPRR